MADVKQTGLKDKMVATTGNKPMTIHQMKDQMVPQFQMVLSGDEKRATRYFRNAVTEHNKLGSGLPQCNPASFWGSVMNAVQLGLELGPIGHVYLIPYKGVCTLQIGYKGLLELVLRSGKVDYIDAYPVYQEDDFDFSLGAHPDIRHKPSLDAEPDDSKIIGFYAVAFIKGCSIPKIEFMTKKQVDGIKNRAQAKSGPWITDYAEMGRKTVLKRICKHLPLSVEVQEGISKDETVRRSTSLIDTLDDTQSIYDIPDTSVTSKSEVNVKMDVSTGEIIEVAEEAVADDGSSLFS